MRISTCAVIAVALVAACGQATRADLLAGWDFQTTTNGGTALAAAPDTPKVITANFGSGTMYLDGTNGSSNWNATTTGNELSAFAGTAVNAGTGFSTTTTSPASLALLNQTANGKSATFVFGMTGYKDLVVSYASQRTGTGFTDQTWAWSTNGTTFTTFDTQSSIPAAFGLVTLSTLAALDNAVAAYLRVTFTGATSASGNNRLDNIQFNATAIPEPTSMALVGLALGGVLIRPRRS